MRYTGVTARGIIAPIFKEGDDLIAKATDCVLSASENEGFSLNDGDIVGITEAVVARTQGNYATCAQIATDLTEKFGGENLGIVFPILSRNRFSILLKAIALSTKKLYIQLSYPSDEVGNSLVEPKLLEEHNVNPYSDSFNEKEFRAIFGNDTVHKFTGVDYIEFYKSFGDNIEIIFSNDPCYILKYTKNVLNCDIHPRFRTQNLLKKNGAERSYRLDEILTSSINGSGYNPMYGLLGSNKASEDRVKLFPKDTDAFIAAFQKELYNKTGKNFEVLVYGDGCFKDPVGGIWELADPVVSPSFTAGLTGTPNEIKMKYFADNNFADLKGEELQNAMKDHILKKDKNLVGNMDAQGTTPRQLSDLVGSLCDLVSGSGDKGTPIVLVQGYFKNYANE